MVLSIKLTIFVISYEMGEKAEYKCTYIVVVQLLSCVQLFVTPWTAARQASLSITISRNLLKLMSIESAMPSNHPVIPFSSCLQSFPASGSFPMSQLFTSGGQSIGASASSSVLPMNIQDWFPLGLTGMIFCLKERWENIKTLMNECYHSNGSGCCESG